MAQTDKPDRPIEAKRLHAGVKGYAGKGGVLNVYQCARRGKNGTFQAGLLGRILQNKPKPPHPVPGTLGESICERGAVRRSCIW